MATACYNIDMENKVIKVEYKGKTIEYDENKGEWFVSSKDAKNGRKFHHVMLSSIKKMIDMAQRQKFDPIPVIFELSGDDDGRYNYSRHRNKKMGRGKITSIDIDGNMYIKPNLPGKIERRYFVYQDSDKNWERFIELEQIHKQQQTLEDRERKLNSDIIEFKREELKNKIFGNLD